MRDAWRRTRGYVPSGVRNALSRIDLMYRRTTARDRVLPDFLILGAQKAGTTSLYDYLIQHPQIVAADVKESHFFGSGISAEEDNFPRGVEWYRAYFPTRGSLCSGCITGEATPVYLYHPLAPGRIQQVLPDVRMVALLRHPVERAISHYHHMRRLGEESRSIEEALEQEAQRLSQYPKGEELDRNGFGSSSYLARGLYKQQLDRYFGRFRRDQLLVLCSERFFERPHDALAAVFRFLGVDADFSVKNMAPRNVGADRRAIDASLYKALEEFFRPDNEALFELLGEDYWWERSSQ